MNTDVDPDKWEQIAYADIEQGDKLKVVVVGVRENFKSRTVTEAVADFKSYNGWNQGTIRIATVPGIKAYGFTETFYREKVPPYEFPTGFGAVVKGESLSSPGVYNTFVFDGCDGWIVRSTRNYRTQQFLRNNYKNFETLSEGVK